MTSAEPESLGTAALVRRGPFARFFWAAVIGSTGDWVTVFAMLTLADRIGSQEGVLIALMSRILPGLVLGGVVGVISDRVDRRKLVVFADLGRGLFVPLLALVNTLPQLVGITLLLELLSLMGQPPRTAMVPRLVPAENLVGANSLMLGAAYGTVPLGSAVLLALAGLPNVSLGGLIPVANESLAPAFAVDALTFFVSGLLIATLPRIAAQAAVPTESTNNNVDLRSTWADFIAGAKFFATEPSVRRVIIGMTTALFGGGTIIVLGPEFAKTVLDGRDAGFYAIITMLGIGAGAGLALVSANEGRFVHRDLVFGIATTVCGLSLAAASLVTTVPGAAAWMTVMGLGAGSAYLMGLTHLHEYVDDEMRGRIFATLFALMRIGLFIAMALAVPLVGVFRNVDIGRLDNPTRVVLLLGGLTIMAAGLGVLWAMRSLLRSMWRGPVLGREAKDIIAAANKARRTRLPTKRSGREDE